MHDVERRPSVVLFSCFFAWNRINAGFKKAIDEFIRRTRARFEVYLCFTLDL